MNSICGANCEICSFSSDCRGCAETCGRPFGGTCVAAQYIQTGGMQKYLQFKQDLLHEINSLLKANQLPAASALSELPGSFVNIPYPLPNGKAVQFLDDQRIYLGSQIEFADRGICYGVVADTTFILICSYSIDGSEPELILYRKR